MEYEWPDLPGFGRLGLVPREIPEPTSRAAIYDRLELLRLALGLSKTGFAQLWGISTSAYDHLRTGRQNVTVDQAQKLCARTGVTFDFIYRGMWPGMAAELKASLQDAEARRDEGEDPEIPAKKRRRRS